MALFGSTDKCKILENVDREAEFGGIIGPGD